MTKLSLIVPTYDEALNVVPILEAIRKELLGRDFEVIVVDDDSPDLTWQIAQGYAQRQAGVRVHRRIDRKDLSEAVVEGFDLAQGDALGVMDADLSHDPAILTALWDAIDQGAEIAVGSRTIEGGGAERWPWHRRLYSALATGAARFFLGVPLSDPMSGYFMIRRSLYERVRRHLRPKGYKILLEIVARARPSLVAEVPFVFKDRQQGYSKLGPRVVKDYLLMLVRLFVATRFSHRPSH